MKMLKNIVLFCSVLFSSVTASDGQSIGVSGNISPSKNTQDWSPLEWMVGSLCSPRDSQESFPMPQFKGINSSVLSFLHSPTPTSIHDTGKTKALTRWTFVHNIVSLHFNMLSRLVITCLPRSKHLLSLWLQSPSAVILEPPKIKSATVSIIFPIYLPWSDGSGCQDRSFLNVEP